MMAAPSVPDCDETPMRPGRGRTPTKVASSDTSGAVLTTPMELGPTRRMPWRWASSTTPCSSSAPASPDSEKPALITTRPCTRLCAQSSTTAATWSADTHTTARSMSSGTSRIDGYERTLATYEALTLTGYTGPWKPPSSSRLNTSYPMEPGRREAPTTATERGARRRRTDCAKADRARASITASASGVGSMLSSTSMTPSVKRLEASNPACLKTDSILRFWGRTWAVKPVSPTSRAAAARYSSSTVASPRPWWAPSVKKATSATLDIG